MPKQASTVSSGRALIVIYGESPMAEQLAEICAAKNYDVLINTMGGGKPNLDSEQIRISASIPSNASVGIELTNTDHAAKRANLEKLDKALPATAPILSSSITVAATEQTTWISGKHRLVGFCALPTLLDKPLVEVAPTIFSPRETVEVVQRFFQSLGKEIELVQDRVGMVMPRIICQLINEAAFALQEEIASPQDIDTAMKLGVHYPLGPIEWAEKIGVRQVYAVLAALENDLKEDRYRVAPLLRQMAIAGEWWQKKS
jgi:3-hydroxybutyryl-CoA dehydrogenase